MQSLAESNVVEHDNLAPEKTFRSWDDLHQTVMEYSKKIDRPVTHKGWYLNTKDECRDTVHPYARGSFMCFRHTSTCDFKIPYLLEKPGLRYKGGVYFCKSK